jgi:hypothetical protein
VTPQKEDSVAGELTREELRRLARIGAARRLEELRMEEAAIRAAFPDLDAGAAPQARRGGRRRTARRATADATRSRTRKSSYKMSAAQKKAVSERMKKYWAARRKAKE